MPSRDMFAILRAGLKLQVKLESADALISEVKEMQEFHPSVLQFLKNRALILTLENDKKVHNFTNQFCFVKSG